MRRTATQLPELLRKLKEDPSNATVVGVGLPPHVDMMFYTDDNGTKTRDHETLQAIYTELDRLKQQTLEPPQDHAGRLYRLDAGVKDGTGNDMYLAYEENGRLVPIPTLPDAGVQKNIPLSHGNALDFYVESGPVSVQGMTTKPLDMTRKHELPPARTDPNLDDALYGVEKYYMSSEKLDPTYNADVASLVRTMGCAKDKVTTEDVRLQRIFRTPPRGAVYWQGSRLRTGTCECANEKCGMAHPNRDAYLYDVGEVVRRTRANVDMLDKKYRSTVERLGMVTADEAATDDSSDASSFSSLDLDRHTGVAEGTWP
jgi:hypothetical protein